MKFLHIIFLLCLQFNFLLAKDVPYLSGRVIDETKTLSATTISELESKLAKHEEQTSNQIVVLIISSLDGEVLEDFSHKVASTWKLGQKGKDNGVLLLIAKNDRKLRIEVGYGLEGTLTDMLCNQIIRREITPKFKSGDFDKGVQNGIDSILNAIQGTYTQTEEKKDSLNGLPQNLENADMPISLRVVTGVIFFIVITPFTILTAVTPYVGWFLYFFLMPFYAIFPPVIFGVWGAVLLPIYIVFMFIAKIYFGFTKSGQKIAEGISSSVGSSSGGGSSGGSWSSGSSSGGSFSGGGGSFGGGGSSGSW